MADTVSKAQRSLIMAAVKSKDTKPELAIRKGLHAMGFRYSLHQKRLPGKPDIVLARHKAVVFVHGCFWHQHGCSFSRIPEDNATFWRDKFARNQGRDSLTVEALLGKGWRVAIVRECALRGKGRLNLKDVLQALYGWLIFADTPFLCLEGSAKALLPYPPGFLGYR